MQETLTRRIKSFEANALFLRNIVQQLKKYYAYRVDLSGDNILYKYCHAIYKAKSNLLILQGSGLSSEILFIISVKRSLKIADILISEAIVIFWV